MTVNRICFIICLLCIASGVGIGVVGIWIPQTSDVIPKAFFTVGLIGAGAILTGVVNSTLTGKTEPPK